MIWTTPMRRRLGLFLLTSIPLALAAAWIFLSLAPMRQASSVTGSEHAAAEDLYRDRCAACHGVAREGGAGPSLAHISDRRSAAKIARIAQFGKGRNKQNPMPAGLADAEEARILARWLSTSEG